jgi:molybdenum cofactor guanylyltransferase
LQADGPTLIETVVERLREAGLGEGLLVVTNSPKEYAFLGLPVLPDEVPGAGPLGGILTALVQSQCERVLVVACDMPSLNQDLLRYMAGLPDDADLIMPRWVDDKGLVRLETLHAVYSQRCIKPIRGRIEAGKLQVNELVDEVPTRYLDEEELRHFDPDLRSFRNVNTPEDISVINK